MTTKQRGPDDDGEGCCCSPPFLAGTSSPFWSPRPCIHTDTGMTKPVESMASIYLEKKKNRLQSYVKKTAQCTHFPKTFAFILRLGSTGLLSHCHPFDRRGREGNYTLKSFINLNKISTRCSVIMYYMQLFLYSQE